MYLFAVILLLPLGFSATVDQSKSHASPDLNYTLKPISEVDGNITALQVNAVVKQPQLSAGDVLLALPIQIAKVDVGRFENDSLSAWDEAGPLELVREIDRYGPPIVYQKWTVRRATTGDVRASYIALPRIVNETTKNAPSFELRQNFGGLVASGFGFLATPPIDEWDNTTCKVQISWDLDASPAGTRAVWTWGLGPQPVAKTMFCAEIQSTYFAVGAVKSHEMGEYGMYWLGDPPFNATDISVNLQHLFKFMSNFFKDNEGSYRVFLRHNPFPGSMAGTALARSFMFSYSVLDVENPPSDEDRLVFLSHEMTHNWVNLASTNDNWYSEGMADYYSLRFSLKTGSLQRHNYLIRLNEMLMQYYTNPLVNLSNDEVAKLTWKSSLAQRIPYGRGLAFALQTNAHITSATNHTKSIDDLILLLCQRAADGVRLTVSDYLDGLARLLGDDHDARTKAKSMYEDMSSGKIVHPLKNSFQDLKLSPVKSTAPIWELGFDEEPAIQGNRVVSGLVPGSRAEQAGLLEGDHILNHMQLEPLKRDPGARLHLDLERNGSEFVSISYLPRGNRTLAVWQFVDDDEEEEEEGEDALHTIVKEL